MIDLFKKKHKYLIGVDISSTHIKMLELSGYRDNLKLENYVIESIPEGLYADHNVANIEGLAEIVKSVWGKLGTNNKNVSIAMPASMIISKKFEMQDGLKLKDQMYQVEAEASNYIPFALDEVNLDYQIIGPVDGKDDRVEVYLAVSKEQHVDERLAVVQLAGLNTKVLDIDQMAVTHAIEEMSSNFETDITDKNIMVVYLGEQHTEYQVLRNFESIYTRDHNFSLVALKNNIIAKYNCSEQEADSLIKNTADTGNYPDYDSALLQPFLDSIAIEIIRHIQLFESSGIWIGVDHIVLSGAAAILDGLEDTIIQRTSIETLIANPLSNCHLSNRIHSDNLLNDAPSLVTAFGLALRSFA